MGAPYGRHSRTLCAVTSLAMSARQSRRCSARRAASARGSRQAESSARASASACEHVAPKCTHTPFRARARCTERIATADAAAAIAAWIARRARLPQGMVVPAHMADCSCSSRGPQPAQLCRLAPIPSPPISSSNSSITSSVGRPQRCRGAPRDDRSPPLQKAPHPIRWPSLKQAMTRDAARASSELGTLHGTRRCCCKSSMQRRRLTSWSEFGSPAAWSVPIAPRRP